jgi:acetyl esterase/lipase
MDTSSPSSIIRALVPKVPLIVKTTAFHTLGISETSWKWTLQQQLIITVMRSILGPEAGPKKLSSSQRASLHDPGVKGKKWISRYTIPKPPEGSSDVAERLFSAIDALKSTGDGDEAAYKKPELAAIDVEWTGHRADAGDSDPEPPDMSESEKYANLMKEVTSDAVVLYLHGGAYYLMSPASHRHVTSRLARLTGGRCMSVAYRLAPQNPFPSALMDALVAYLSLLSPPPGAPHSAVPASKIVISGDSAGGNLSSVLLQLLLQLHRAAAPNGKVPTLSWYGRQVPVPLPAGVALNSPWCDLTSCMPSIQRFAKFDYLPNSWDATKIIPCSIWPATPPRVDIYADGSALCHPLVSPLGASDWTGAPPVWFGVGEELLADEGAGMACAMARQGVRVVWEQYEAMPHCFALVFDADKVAELCYDGWAGFITQVVGGGKDVRTKGTYVSAKKWERTDVDVTRLLDGVGVKLEDVPEMMRKSKDKAVGEFLERERNVPPSVAGPSKL